MENDARLNVRIPKVLLDDIKRTADEQRISPSALVKLACAQYIKKANRENK